MSKLENLRDNLCEELDKMAKKEAINTADLEIIDKLTHSIKNLDKVMLGNEMIEEYGYSFERGYSGARRGGRRGRDGDSDGRYNEGNSREGRRYERDHENSYDSYGYANDSYGDRSYTRGYSGHYDDKSIERFKHKMQDAIHEL